jgi:hypothetical protein
MSSARLCAVTPAAAIVLAALSAAAHAQTRAGENAPVCVRETIVLADAVDSAHARVGDSFRFRTAEATTASDGTAVPANALGYGIVSAASHAERGGRGGYLALEPRVLTLENGKRIPVIADRFPGSRGVATGKSRNASGFLNAIPFLGYGLGAYGYLHHGADVTIPAGTRLSVLIGDDLALGTCRLEPMQTPPPRRQAPFPF